MIILTDIDDTLMKTKRKIKNLPDCSIGAYSESGEPLSYIEPFRQDFIDNFLGKHIFIPVTARSYNALNRVKIKFNHEKIINFGAHILNHENKIISEWNDFITSNQNNFNIIEKINFIEKNFSIHNHIELIKRTEFDHFIFFNFRNSHLSLEENVLFSKKLEEFLEKNKINDFYLYTTDRDVTMIPCYIKKELAVEFVMKKYPNMTSIGIGDHKNDFNFMHLCHFSIFPNDSSISKLLKEFK